MSKGIDYFSKSLEKGLKILTLFNAKTPVLTQSEIAKTLGLNMTSTYRYINTLVELGYLEKDSKSKEIRPAAPCLQFCINLIQAADHLKMIRQVVDGIHRQYNISIDMAYVIDDALVRIYHREAEETFTYSLPSLSRSCLHNTALGKAYLSTLPQDVLREKIDNMDMVVKTDRTRVEKDSLFQEIQETRKRKYSIVEEEYLQGLLAIGAPLIDPMSGKGVGAVSFDFSILQHNMEEIREKYGALIVRTAEELSRLLPLKSS